MHSCMMLQWQKIWKSIYWTVREISSCIFTYVLSYNYDPILKVPIFLKAWHFSFVNSGWKFTKKNFFLLSKICKTKFRLLYEFYCQVNVALLFIEKKKDFSSLCFYCMYKKFKSGFLSFLVCRLFRRTF